ncbi:MAG: FAD-dependent oxidoreductase [Clostridiales bacterium]|nr:FAD-dependent oxidoreductase [Clostridiales bacterium]
MKQTKSMFSPLKAWKYLVKEPVTISKKNIFLTPREASDRYRGFHVNDHSKCTGCGTCGEICPTLAINMIVLPDQPFEDGKKNERPAIDYGRCSFCGLCVDICTSDSLRMTKEYIHTSLDVETFNFMPGENGIHNTYQKPGYGRDEVSELLDLDRYEMKHENASRKNSFIEIVKGFSTEMALAESSRCVECGVCTQTCPAEMNIPEYIKTVYDGDLQKGIEWIYKTNPMANVCGRICTHKCETACVIGNRGDAVAIRWLKRYIVDNTPMDQYEAGALAYVTEKTQGKVAIVGSGPSGLSCAYYLSTLGYEVDVYEKNALPGGVIRYGGPEYRLPEASVINDITMIEKAGVNFICNSELGKEISLETLRDQYDSVFLGIGFSYSRPLPIPGSDNKEVKFAIEFLGQTRDYNRNMGEMPDIKDEVVVIGGGNVAFDVARTLIRLQEEKYGKSSVSMAALEHRGILPADLEEIEEGEEEGLNYSFGYGPQSIEIKDDVIVGLKVKKVNSIFDANGQFNPSYDETDVKIIPAKQVYIAIGQMANYDFFNEEMKSKIDIFRGKVKVKDNGQFDNYPWLFAGGDIVRGPDIINGVATGHDAAKAIDMYIRSK